MANRPRYRVPDELREALLDFTVAYLLERPDNLPAFGVTFFQHMQDERARIGVQPLHRPTAEEEDAQSEPEEPAPRIANTRRKSVSAEAYNPEEDQDERPTVVHPKSDIQRARLAEAVKNILLFRSLDPEQMQTVLDAMFERHVKKGEYVIRQGEDGDNFYVIDKGMYKVYVQGGDDPTPHAISSYENSGSFGELALMYNMPRAATVQAETDGLLWAMDRQTFRHIVLKSAFKKRQMYEHLLDSVPMLSTLTSYERMNLADALVPRNYTDGQVIIHQGDHGDGMYFVEDGTVIVKRAENGHESELTRITVGGYFGELALLTNQPRAATITAAGHVKCAFLDVEAFERLLGPCMEIMKRNAQDYDRQLVQLFGSRTNITDIRWN